MFGFNRKRGRLAFLWLEYRVEQNRHSPLRILPDSYCLGILLIVPESRSPERVPSREVVPRSGYARAPGGRNRPVRGPIAASALIRLPDVVVEKRSDRDRTRAWQNV